VGAEEICKDGEGIGRLPDLLSAVCIAHTSCPACPSLVILPLPGACLLTWLQRGWRWMARHLQAPPPHKRRRRVRSCPASPSVEGLTS